MNGRVRAAKMPNPSIATAVESYAGIMNIGNAFYFVGPERLGHPDLRDTASKDVRTLRVSDAAKGRVTPDRRP